MKANHAAKMHGGLLLRSYFYFLVCAGALLMPCAHAAAQQYTYTQYTEKDGLAASTVYGITQDRQGFLWFSTETGVSRFDGVHFTNFTTEDGLPANEVFGTCEDLYGRLWITSFSKQLCYYKNGRIWNMSNDPLLKRIKNEYIVMNIREDVNRDVIFETTNSVIVLHGDEVSYHSSGYSFVISRFFWREAIINIGKHQQPGRQFIVSERQEQQDRETNHIPEGIRKWAMNYYPALMFSVHNAKVADGIYFTITDSNILVLDAKKHDPVIDKIPTTLKYNVVLDSNTIASKIVNTFLLYDVKERKIKRRFTLPCVVNEIFRDREGEYWFSTKGQGLFKLASPSFGNYKCTSKGISFSILNIQKRGKDIYAGDDNGGFWKYDTSLHTLSAVDMQKDIMFPENVLVNTYQYVLRQKYPRLYDQFSFPSKTIFKHGNKLLISTASNVRMISLPEMAAADIRVGRSTCSLESDGSYYIGTLAGLYKVSKDKSELFFGEQDTGLGSRISFIAKSPDGIIWVATYGSGIIGLRDDKVVARVAYLKDKVCLCLFIHEGNMWAGTNKGLYKIELASGKYAVAASYNAFDGLGSDIVNCIFVADRKVYAGTSAGLTVFDEDVPASSFSLLYLTGIKVSGREQSLTEDRISLLHADNNIRFEFAGLSYRSGNEITYSYRLAGLDNVWKTTKESYLAYPSLPSGSYTLEMTAANRFGEVSKPVNFHFTILPSVWEKWWVRLLIVLLFAVSVFAFVKIRIRQIKLKSAYIIAAQKRMTELEQMALRAQMNPHFIFNCLNSIQSFTIKQDTKGANIYLSRFAGLIRQTLENSPKMLIPLAEEIAYLTNYIELERLQMAGGFEFEIRTTFDSAREAAIQIPNMVVQPYLENAVKHGLGSCRFPVPRLSVVFSIEGPMLICVIEDNGPGIGSHRQEHHKHVSMGMSITAKRIEMLNLVNKGAKQQVTTEVINLNDADPLLSGTRVILKFPL